jgi:hypothetical protein
MGLSPVTGMLSGGQSGLQMSPRDSPLGNMRQAAQRVPEGGGA